MAGATRGDEGERDMGSGLSQLSEILSDMSERARSEKLT
ncbi:hypothetical protein HJC23_012262 [Cyclotella cryptica]|uniref:Uncharacterized protein n=1 Tax=Cyclotella cryptica TaxID=29204 RepID=A0ABD3PLY4_9STRA